MNRVDLIKSRFAKYGLIRHNWQVFGITRGQDIEPVFCEDFLLPGKRK